MVLRDGPVGGTVWSSTTRASELAVWKDESGVGCLTGGVSMVCEGGDGAESSATGILTSVVGTEGGSWVLRVVLSTAVAAEGSKEPEVPGGASPCTSPVDSTALVSWMVSRFVVT